MLRLDLKLFIAVVFILQGAFDLYAGARLHTTYRNASELALVHAELRDHLKNDAVLDAALKDWVKALDAAIYAPIPDKPVPVGTRKPTAVETWQVNRDRELRERLQRLEQWRMRLDSER